MGGAVHPCVLPIVRAGNAAFCGGVRAYPTTRRVACRTIRPAARGSAHAHVCVSVPEACILMFSPSSVPPPRLLPDAIGHWPALTRWSDEHLSSTLGPSPLTVALTPNGLADAVVACQESTHGGVGDPATAPLHDAGRCFALPHQTRMSMREFLTLLRDTRCAAFSGPHVVPYLQYQNSSLTTEAAPLRGDVDDELAWASAAFGEGSGGGVGVGGFVVWLEVLGGMSLRDAGCLAWSQMLQVMGGRRCACSSASALVRSHLTVPGPPSTACSRAAGLSSSPPLYNNKQQPSLLQGRHLTR